MSKELKLNVGDTVDLLGKTYEVIVVGKNQITLKSVKDGKQRRVSVSSPIYNNIKVIDAVEATEEEEKPKRKIVKRLGTKEAEVVEYVPMDVVAFEAESWQELVETTNLVNEKPEFKFQGKKKLNGLFYSLQRATKAQRIEFVTKKLELDGKDSLFGLFLALYKVRQEYHFDFNIFESRILLDEVHSGSRAKEIKIAEILKAMKPALNKSQAKIGMEIYDNIIKLIPDDGEDAFQSWIFYAFDGLWNAIGSLKLSVQDLDNINIPMA